MDMENILLDIASAHDDYTLPSTGRLYSLLDGGDESIAKHRRIMDNLEDSNGNSDHHDAWLDTMSQNLPEPLPADVLDDNSHKELLDMLFKPDEFDVTTFLSNGEPKKVLNESNDDDFYNSLTTSNDELDNLIKGFTTEQHQPQMVSQYITTLIDTKHITIFPLSNLGKITLQKNGKLENHLIQFGNRSMDMKAWFSANLVHSYTSQNRLLRDNCISYYLTQNNYDPHKISNEHLTIINGVFDNMANALICYNKSKTGSEFFIYKDIALYLIR